MDTNKDSNIVVTGFMGTGKSTVGKLLADKLGRPYLDTDEEIVRRIGMSIPEVFQRDGEERFRHIERRMCRFLAAQGGYIISTGGGMLVDDSNREVMLASGFVVCLSATPEAIAERLKTDKTERPLLKGDWRGLLAKRKPAYLEIPNQVDTTGKTPEAIANEIIQLWQTVSV